jgi:hypothetical protein
MASSRTENWQAIREIYEQGGLSNRELARRYAPLSEGAIRKRAKQECWARPERVPISRPAPIVPRAKPVSRVDAWRRQDPLATCFLAERGERKSPRTVSAKISLDESFENLESAGVELLDFCSIIIRYHGTMMKMIDQYAEDYQISYRRYVQMHKQFSLSALSADLRDIAVSLKRLRSTRAQLARSSKRSL